MSSTVRDLFVRRVMSLRETDPALFYMYGRRDPTPDLTSDGYARVSHEFVESVTFDVIHYGVVGNTLSAAVKCTVVLNVDGKRIVSEEVGEASTAEAKVLERNAALRFAATRARKRALAHAMGIDRSTIIKVVEGKSIAVGEDYDVPFDDS